MQKRLQILGRKNIGHSKSGGNDAGTGCTGFSNSHIQNQYYFQCLAQARDRAGTAKMAVISETLAPINRATTTDQNYG